MPGLTLGLPCKKANCENSSKNRAIQYHTVLENNEAPADRTLPSTKMSGFPKWMKAYSITFFFLQTNCGMWSFGRHDKTPQNCSHNIPGNLKMRQAFLHVETWETELEESISAEWFKVLPQLSIKKGQNKILHQLNIGGRREEGVSVSMHSAVRAAGISVPLEKNNVCYSNYFHKDSQFPCLPICSGSSDPGQLQAEYRRWCVSDWDTHLRGRQLSSPYHTIINSAHQFCSPRIVTLDGSWLPVNEATLWLPSRIGMATPWASCINVRSREGVQGWNWPVPMTNSSYFTSHMKEDAS